MTRAKSGLLKTKRKIDKNTNRVSLAHVIILYHTTAFAPFPFERAARAPLLNSKLIAAEIS